MAVYASLHPGVDPSPRVPAAPGEFRLASLPGFELTAVPSAAAGFLALWALLAAAARHLARLSLPAAVAAGLAAALLHWSAETVHQLGHAWAARRTGYPMRGIRYWGLLSTSLYPPGEPRLPAEIHIRRALGGAPASIALGFFAGLLALAFRRRSPTAALLAAFVCIDSGAVLGLGALVPLPGIDGGTLRHYWPRRGQPVK